MEEESNLTEEEKALAYQLLAGSRGDALFYDLAVLVPSMGMIIYGLVSENFVVGAIGVGIYCVLRLRLTLYQERFSSRFAPVLKKLLRLSEGKAADK